MSLERIPPIILAVDNEDYVDAIELIDDLAIFEPDEVGIKVPIHHLNRPEIIDKAKSDGRYIILDTRLHDDAEHMAASARSLLNRHEALMPDAITVLPFFRSSSVNAERIKQGVMQAAHEKGVKIIGYSGEIDQEKGIDDTAVRYEAVCFMNARNMEFDGYELHAANLLNPGFLEEIGNTLTAVGSRTRNTTPTDNQPDDTGQHRLSSAQPLPYSFVKPDITYQSLADGGWPTVISSKFKIPISVGKNRPGTSSGISIVKTLPSSPEILAKNGINISAEQLQQKALVVAGHIFNLCASSIYLGRSVTQASPMARWEYVRKILEIKRSLGEILVADSIERIKEEVLYIAES